MISENFNTPTLVVVAGPTAVGKTQFCIALAKQYGCPIISADSRQFYREMNIGTAAPSKEEMSGVTHYFVGHLSIKDYYSVSRFEQDVLQLLPTLFQYSNTVIMTGGSGLYLDAVCYGIDELPDPDPAIREEVITLYENEGLAALQTKLQLLDPEYYESVDIANHKRLIRAIEVCLQTGKPYSSFRSMSQKVRDFDIVKYCLSRPRDILFSRINQRVDLMMEQGFLEEATQLYPYRHLNALNTVGYKELFQYLDGVLSLEEAVNDIKTHTRRYAKRQLSWFKRDASYQYVDLP